MNFSLIYITIIRLGLYVRMYIVQHNFNSSPSHPHSPRWQIYNNPKIERKKHKENEKYGHNERMVRIFRASDLVVFFSSRHCMHWHSWVREKKSKPLLQLWQIGCDFGVYLWFQFRSLDPIWKRWRFFGLVTTCYCVVVILRDHAQFLAMTCKCINELGTYL